MKNNTPDTDTIAGDVCKFIRSNILAKGISFDSNSSLDEFGIDSFSTIEILLFIERRFNVVVPETYLTRENLKSVSTLANCVSMVVAD